jgi:hypothetical protein
VADPVLVDVGYSGGEADGDLKDFEVLRAGFAASD